MNAHKDINHQPHLKKYLSLIVKETEKVESSSSFISTNEEAFLFEENYELLRKDGRTEYLKDSELKDELWYLTCEVWGFRKKFINSQELQLKIKSFIKELCKPFEEYEVVFKVENLKIKKRTKVWDSLIVNYTKKTLMKKGFKHSEKFLSKLVDDFEKQTLLLVTETGNNSSFVVDRARRKGNEIAKILQTYLSEMPFVNNEQLLFSLSEDYLIRKKDESKLLSSGWRRDFSPILFDYEEQFKRFTEKANKHYILLNDFPEKLQNCVKRTITWIGKAISEEDFDLKVAFLCTALETLLTTKQDGRKGEKIAYRTALLRRHFEETVFEPRRALQLYLIRNDVIHGSKIGIASKSEYHSLLRLIRETLDYFIKLVHEKELKKQTEVLTFLINSQYTTELLEWLKTFPDENSAVIMKALEEDILGDKIIPVCLLLKK